MTRSNEIEAKKDTRFPAAGPSPLRGVRIIELAGIGPGPMACMMLADLGAEVVRVERPGRKALGRTDISRRGKRLVQLDFRNAGDREDLLKLVERADVLVDPFRPGVMERLSLSGPLLRQRNPKLVFARVTGWGQTGPLSRSPGHDINFIALTGVLHAIGTATEPLPPLNLIADMGGGLFLAFSILAGLLQAQAGTNGPDVDVAMIDAAALMMWMTHGYHHDGRWDSSRRVVNLFDGGAPFYCAYETSDGKHVAVGAIEPAFYERLVADLGLDRSLFEPQMDQTQWPRRRNILGEIFKTRTRDEWCSMMEGTDACLSPVLALDETPFHEHHVFRGTYASAETIVQPAPAPLIDHHRPIMRSGPAVIENYGDILRDWTAACGACGRPSPR